MMIEKNWTPGPWKVFGGPSHPQRHHLAVIDSIPDRDGKVVANCICHVAGTNDDADANARLISKAPELYDVLEELLMHWLTHHHDLREDAPAVVFQARNVLREARSGSNDPTT